MAKPTMIKTRIDNCGDERDSARLEQLEQEFLGFLYSLGNSRELSKAKGHIEEAAMWTRKFLANR